MRFSVTNNTFLGYEPLWLYDSHDPIWTKIQAYKRFDAGDILPIQFGDAYFGYSCATFIVDDMLHIIPDVWCDVGASPNHPSIVVINSRLENTFIYKCTIAVRS